MNDIVTLQLADATVQIPHATVMRNFLDSLGRPTIAAAVPPIGEQCSGQGGVNAGLMRNPYGPDYWLIVPTDPAADLGKMQWGGSGKDEPNAVDEYDGRVNTRVLVESDHDHPAAQACAALTIDGHSDFYLPARRELALLYANVPELFEKGWHWSSTQSSAGLAWGQYFAHGYQYGGYKVTECRVRPVRRLVTSSI